MMQYSELSDAIKEVLNKANESDSFKKRLTQLIENSMEDSYRDDDIVALIEMLNKKEE